MKEHDPERGDAVLLLLLLLLLLLACYWIQLYRTLDACQPLREVAGGSVAELQANDRVENEE